MIYQILSVHAFLSIYVADCLFHLIISLFSLTYMTEVAGALTFPGIDVDPLEPNVWEQWYSWYQLHYHQLVGIICGLLVVLCGLNLCASCQRKQDIQYVGVKRVSDTDTECDIEVQPMMPIKK